MNQTMQPDPRLHAGRRAAANTPLLRLACLVTLIGALFLQPAWGAEHVSDDWQFSIIPYMWALAASGDATVEGTEADVDLKFSDIWDALNVAVMVEADVRKGRWGAFVNPLYAQLEWDEPRVDATLDITVVSFGGAYRLGPWALDAKAGTSGPVLVVDLYAGGRYNNLSLDVKVDIDLPGPLPDIRRKADGNEDWVDPIVGLRTGWHLSPKWVLAASGDIGGFGVGADFTWMATGLVGYNFGLWGEDNATAFGGYRALSWDYKKGSGDDRFEWDATFHGPLVGFSYRF